MFKLFSLVVLLWGLLTIGPTACLALAFERSSSSTSSPSSPPPESFWATGRHRPKIRERPILRVLTLVDETSGTILGQCHEMVPFPEEEAENKPDEDELEVLYPTSRRFFSFRQNHHPDNDKQYKTERTGDDTDDDNHHGEDEVLIQIRSTSFGCGKLGHQIWPSSIAMSLYLTTNNFSTDNNYYQNLTILELGAGCGLPSLVCRDVLKAKSVIATDFWMESDNDFDPNRLLPEIWHGINLQFNVEQKPHATVQRLDWHRMDDFSKHLSSTSIDLVIGSDLVYYTTDLEPLWKTLQFFLKECGTKEILLFSPLKPDSREALPTFIETLQNLSSSSGGLWHAETKEMILFKDDTMTNGDRFLKMSIKPL